LQSAVLNKPFGIAFIHRATPRSFLYVANTDGVVRFPYRNGDLKARGLAQQLAAIFRPELGCAAADTGHDALSFHPTVKKMYVSIGSRSNVSDNAAEEKSRAHLRVLILTAADKRFTPGEFATLSHRVSARHKRSFG